MFFSTQQLSSGPVYTLSGDSISDTSISRTTTAGVRINSDGTVDELINASYSQISAATDWVRPSNAADGDHDVRITNVVFNSGTVFLDAAAVEDTWIDLSADREWSVQDADSGASGSVNVDFDIEIRDPDMNTVATGSYTLNVLYDST